MYELGRIFRNEGMSIKHNPEFTSIELYEAYTDYHGMMDLCENIFVYCAQKLFGGTELTYQGAQIELKQPWARMTMAEAVRTFAHADFEAQKLTKRARALAKSIGLEVKDSDTKGVLLNTAFEEFVEQKLIQPTFICDYPVEVSPLAKRKADEPWLTERFELFITGREMANAFSELNDPDDQRDRFLAQAAKREAGDEEAHGMDEDFICALEYGMPPTGGMGIGIDRMVMLFCDAASIRGRSHCFPR